MKKNNFEDVWKFINIGNINQCWEWFGYKNKFGYGGFVVSQKQYVPHRIVFKLTYPNLIEFSAPKDKKIKQFVLHKCDNPSCCNPHHLFLGNYDDNNKDAKLKSRSNAPKGSNHKKAKLTQDQANQARLFHGHGWTYTEIGKMFNIHPNNISRICKYKSYLESRV